MTTLDEQENPIPPSWEVLNEEARRVIVALARDYVDAPIPSAREVGKAAAAFLAAELALVDEGRDADEDDVLRLLVSNDRLKAAMRAHAADLAAHSVARPRWAGVWMRIRYGRRWEERLQTRAREMRAEGRL